MLIHQWIHLDELYKLIESFFQIIGRKPKNIQKNSEAWILYNVLYNGPDYRFP